LKDSKNIQVIELKESTFIGDQLNYDVIQHVNSKVISKDSFFYFSGKERDSEPVFTYYNNQWWVNRYVGEISFNFQEQEYLIIIKPRFGELFLFELLEVIFNFKFAKSNHSLSFAKKDNDYIKKIIAKIWLNKLTQANKYGLPRSNIKKFFSGVQIKGKLNVRESILPYKSSKNLISSSYEKTINPEIASVLYETYKKLSKSYGLPQINKLPKNAIQVIHHLELAKKQSQKRKTYYDSSTLPKIYQSYKEVIDLSISILSNKTLNNRSSNKSGYSFFLDMAELWEMYLLKVLQDKFSIDGWTVTSEIIQTYKGTFYQRKLIPDIVFRKGNKMAVFDAKYKLMRGSYLDVDRLDFFQIHTYKAYYNKTNQLLISGLLYPIVNNKIIRDPVESILKDSAKFLISGITIDDVVNTEDTIREFKSSTNEFLSLIQGYLSLYN